MSKNEVQGKSIVLKEKPSKVLISIKQINQKASNQKDLAYSRKVSSKIDATDSHTIDILNKFVDEGIVEKTKAGRRNVLTLTDKGEKIADALNEVNLAYNEVAISD